LYLVPFPDKTWGDANAWGRHTQQGVYNKALSSAGTRDFLQLSGKQEKFLPIFPMREEKRHTLPYNDFLS